MRSAIPGQRDESSARQREVRAHAMSEVAAPYPPADGEIRQIHQRRFEIFERLRATAREIRAIEG